MTLLRMQNVRKTFGPVIALDDVSLTVEPRQIHGLLGGNGAGKTTLMNVLYGLYKPDAGQIALANQPMTIQSPRDALRQGIGMVHQHFLQVDRFTVLDNIILGMGRINRRAATEQIYALAEQFGLRVDLEATIESLPIGIRQRVEILKVLYRGVKLLILDEPTTSLTPQEVDDLFEALQSMVETGLSVVFITHKLREVMAVCNRITVLRDGRNVLTLARHEASEKALVQAMVGDQLNVESSLLFAQPQPEPDDAPPHHRPLLWVKHLSLTEQRRPVLTDCTFTIREHELFGLAGVAGNGQQPLAETLMGLRPITAGTVLIGPLNLANLSIAERLQGQVAYIPEDRLQDGVLPRATVAQNLMLGFQRQPSYSRGPFLRWRQIYQAARRLISEYRIRTLGPDDVGANLSGGNIQRLMIARAFSFPAKLLIAHNPTQGLDIASIEFVYHKLLARKDEGNATLLISENLDELMRLCDRIGVIYQGQLMGILERPQFDSYQIGRMMSGGRL